MSATSTPDSDYEGESIADIYLNNMRENQVEEVKTADSSPLFTRSYDRWSPLEEGATLTWSDLSIYAKGRKDEPPFKTLISGVSGAIKPGSLVALMGSSGAGKSTLMAALAHRNSGDTVIQGDILINGRPIGNYMRYISGYMFQDDLFIGSLTVWEHMNVMARLKLDRRIPFNDRKRKILDILKQLGLMKCLNTRIGLEGDKKVLSGGEKKRLAFATELLTDPPILFCDEPTTGLDSYSAQQIISIMNMLAIKGKTIVCTIHQPSSQIFAMFSQLMLLADGKIAYMGSTANAIDFFYKLGYKCPSNYNPADFFIRTLAITPGFEDTSRQTIKRICNEFSVSDYAKEVDVVVQYELHMGTATEHSNYYLRNNFKEIFWWTKLYYITYRFFLDILRNPAIQFLRIVQKMIIAIIIGLCYVTTDQKTQNGIQSLQGALVSVTCENTFPVLYSVLAEFPANIPLFIREYKSGLYSPGTFYISKVFAMLPGQIIEPVGFVTILYYLVGLKFTAYAFAVTAFTSVMIMNISAACGIFFSNAFNSVPNAMLYLIPFDYSLMIMSGFFINLSSLSKYISWTKYVSWLMYGMESFTIVQWEDVHNITCENPNPDLPCLREGSQVLEKYSFSEEHLKRDLWSMVFLCLLFHVLGFLCLLRKTMKK